MYNVYRTVFLTVFLFYIEQRNSDYKPQSNYIKMISSQKYKPNGILINAANGGRDEDITMDLDTEI